MAGMRGGWLDKLTKFQLLSSVLVLFYINGLYCTPSSSLSGSVPVDQGGDGFFPMSPEEAVIPPEGAPQPLFPGAPQPLFPGAPQPLFPGAPQPLIPFLAPSPLAPYTNGSIPKLSGVCPFNFTAAEKVMGITSTDCFTMVAPLLADVICCPQLKATLAVLIGQSSKKTGLLALNETMAKPCLSDVIQVLVSRGANDTLPQICKISPSNLTEGSCPVKDVSELETAVDTSKLLLACEKINVVDECCTQTCRKAVTEAAQNISSKDDDLGDVPQLSGITDDCKGIVLRWLASKLQPVRAKEVLRGLSNCNINKVCPLALPDTRPVVKNCSNVISDRVACCSALENYFTHLQSQIFITNLQAINCAAALGLKLQRENVTSNIYSLCSVTLKKFSLQAGTQESGCLLQSLPSDVTFDQKTGITFLCDLNDNIPATWPSAFQLPASSCNRTVNFPALPAAASGQSGPHISHYHLLIALSAILLL